jgi:hypothetical protein
MINRAFVRLSKSFINTFFIKEIYKRALPEVLKVKPLFDGHILNVKRTVSVEESRALHLGLV